MTIFAYSLQFYQIKTTLACCNDFDFTWLLNAFLNEEKYFYKERNAFVLLTRNDIPPGKYSAHLAVHRASWNIQTRVIALISSHYCPWYHPTSVFKFSSKMFSFSIVLVSFPQTMLLMMFLLSSDIFLSNKKLKIILSSAWTSWSCPCCCWLWFYSITQGVFK